MRFNTLEEWLAWQETLHPTEIELGLARVRAVYQRLGVTLKCPVITVAGTNGKGSCVAMLAAIYHAAGYRVGVYTSPHLLRYNERICINDEEIADQLSEISKQEHVPAGTIVNSWLREKISDYAHK